MNRAAGIGLAGIVILIVGTFLPWLRSGASTRNSYAAAGVLQRLLGVDGLPGALLSAWPFLGAALAVCVLIALAGARIAGAALSLLVCVPVAVTSFVIPGVDPRFGVAPVGYGPVTTGIGAAVATLGAGLLIVAGIRVRRIRPSQHVRQQGGNTP